MLCAKPLRLDDGQVHACGQCMNCRINRRRQWTARILLEGLSHEAQGLPVAWVTLTYSDDNLPLCARGSGPILATLCPGDLQSLWKRMRKHLGAFRYFAVGEYGDRTFRPHYHALVFGLEAVFVEEYLQRDWESRHGHTRTRPWRMSEGSFRPSDDTATARAAYCAHYVTKKMNGHDDPRLEGRHPEFTRMSRRPGIGMCKRLLALHQTYGGSFYLAETGDVRSEVRIGGKVWPLAPTLRNWLRDELGVPRTLRERRELNPDAAHAAPRRVSEQDYERAKEYNSKMERRTGHGRKL